MLVLHHALDIQILHDYLRWLGFHYLSRYLMKVIVTNVSQLFVKQPDFFVLPLDIPALSEWSFPYWTAVLVMAFGVGFQLAGGFSLCSPQFLFQPPDFGRLVDILIELFPAL